MKSFVVFFLLAQSCAHSSSFNRNLDEEKVIGPTLQRSHARHSTHYECDPYLKDRDSDLFKPYVAVGANFFIEKGKIRAQPSVEQGCSD